MMRIDELADLDPANPVQAREAIDEAIIANQHIEVRARIEAGKVAAGRTAISSNAIRLAKRP